MLVPLDPHLHTAKCNELIEAYRKCHEEKNVVQQSFGACNSYYNAVKKCTKEERLARRERNYQKARDMKARAPENLAKKEAFEKDPRPWEDKMREKIEANYVKQQEKKNQQQSQPQQPSSPYC